MPDAEAGHSGETPADERSTRRRRVAITLLGLGVLCSAAGWYANQRAERVSAAQATGRITASRAWQDGDLWYVDVSYQYEVGGKPYRRRETHIVREGPSGEARARAELTQWAVDTDVVVYFDPTRPAHGALARAHGRHWLLFGVGGLWVALGALWMIYDRGRTN